MNHQRPSSLHSHQTLALLQMRIDPAANLISAILSRAFSFTALHSATQTRFYGGEVASEKNIFDQREKSRESHLKDSWEVCTHRPVQLDVHAAEQPRIDCSPTDSQCGKHIVNESCLFYWGITFCISWLWSNLICQGISLFLLHPPSSTNAHIYLKSDCASLYGDEVVKTISTAHKNLKLIAFKLCIKWQLRSPHNTQ